MRAGAGVVIVTHDGGSNWVDLTPGGMSAIQAITCPTATVCFTTAQFGSIYRTLDGGASWSAFTVQGNLGQISCLSASTCFIAGPAGHVLLTTNTGSSWTALTTNQPNLELEGIACRTRYLCVAAGNDGLDQVVAMSADGGSTWSTTYRRTSLWHMTRVACPAPSTCIAVSADGVMLASADGGRSWLTPSSAISRQSLNGISCSVPTACVAVGDAGTIASTANGGSSWSVRTSGTTLTLYGVSCASASACVAVGNQGTILTTADGGQTWTARVSGSTSALRGVSCPTPSVCLAGGDGQLITRSADGGQTWSVVQHFGGAYPWLSLSCFSVTCVAVGASGSITSSADAGMSWFTANPVGTTLSGVSCPDASNCLAVGQPGVLRSTDGGKTWTVPPQTVARHLAIACATISACAIIDQFGVVLTTTDSGTTLTSQQIDNSDSLQNVTCPAADACVISGSDGEILSMRPAVSAARSTVSVVPAFVANDGVSSAVVTVTLQDALKYPIAGRAVSLTQLSGPTAIVTPASATSDALGQATFHVSGTVPGPAAFAVTDSTDGVTLGQTASVTFVANPYTALSHAQYHLAGSDGTSWTDLDPVNLSIALTPTVDSWAIITGNADLWTATSGINQDIAVNVDGTVVGWKESGGYAGTFSPNAATVQTAVQLTGGTTHFVKLQWKTNNAAPGASIFAGAGPWPGTMPAFSPTVLTARLVPVSDLTVKTAASTGQYHLAGSDGATWQDVDNTGALNVNVTPSVDSTAIVSGNVDLWTATAGYNQDIGINLAETDPSTYPGNIVAWKESGGFAGTFSPNAAFVQSVVPLTHGVPYHFKLQWKTNKNAPGANIYAGAGPWPADGGAYSPTRLTVQLVPATASPQTAVSRSQFVLSSSDGNSWTDVTDSTGAGLSLTFTPTASCTAIVSGNLDLWTASTGINQDIGIYLSSSTNPGNIAAWKESGGYAGTFSPNAAYVQTTVGLASGTSYTIKLVWKANKNAVGKAIFAGAGPWPATGTAFSPTRLTVQPVTCS